MQRSVNPPSTWSSIDRELLGLVDHEVRGLDDDEDRAHVYERAEPTGISTHRVRCERGGVLSTRLFDIHDLARLPAFDVGTMATIDAALAEHGLAPGQARTSPAHPSRRVRHTVLEQRDQLLALIERITDSVSTVEGLRDIETTLGGMDTKPTIRQAATHRRNDRR